MNEHSHKRSWIATTRTTNSEFAQDKAYTVETVGRMVATFLENIEFDFMDPTLLMWDVIADTTSQSPLSTHSVVTDMQIEVLASLLLSDSDGPGLVISEQGIMMH